MQIYDTKNYQEYLRFRLGLMAEDRKRGSIKNLAVYVIIEAQSDTLTVKEEGDKLIIDTDHPVNDSVEVHSISLKFAAPAVDHDMLAWISGFRCKQCRDGKCGLGNGLARGLVIRSH